MDAVKFLKERKRMCNKSYDREEGCSRCDAYDAKTRKCKALLDKNRMVTTEDDMIKAVAIVEEWSKKHPKKTRAQDLFEKYPNANSVVVLDMISGSEHRIPVRMCPCQLGYFKANEICPRKEHLVMDHTRAECVTCWLKSVEG